MIGLDGSDTLINEGAKVLNLTSKDKLRRYHHT